jgi:hypothetical protein
MRDTPESKPSAGIDAAYLAAEGLMADAAEAASAQRRRAAVLAAVQAAVQVQQLASQPLHAAPASTERKAANEAHWWHGGWRGAWGTGAAWRGAVAASVLVCSTLLVWRVSEQPEAVVGAAESMALRADKSDAPRMQAAPASAVMSPSSAAVNDLDAVAAAKVQGPAQAAPQNAASKAAIAPSPASVATAPARRAEKPMPAAPQREAAPPAVADMATPAPVQARAEGRAQAAAPGGALSEPPRELAAASPVAPLARSAAPPAAPVPLLPSPSPSSLALPAPQVAAAAAPARPAAAAPLRKADSMNTAAEENGARAKLLATPAAKTSAVDEDKDSDGRTALAQAVLRGDAPAVTLLLKQGANPLTPDRFGQTARDHARSLGNAAVMEALGL